MSTESKNILDRPPKNIPYTSKFAYTLMIGNRTPVVSPGEKIELEIYFSGWGIPEKVKLQCNFSFPELIDLHNPGNLSYCIKLAQDSKTEQLSPVAGTPFITNVKIDYYGFTSIVNPAYFFRLPMDKMPDNGFPRIMAESAWDTHPPLLVQLNTSPKAPSGDYYISLVFTYGNSENILQDSQTTQIHVNSWWERNQGWVSFLGILIALLSLIVTAIFSVIQLV